MSTALTSRHVLTLTLGFGLLSSSPCLAQGDDCATPVTIQGEGAFAFDTSGFSSQEIWSACATWGAATLTSEDGWFRWVPQVEGTYWFSVCEPDFDPVLSLWELDTSAPSICGGSLSLLACDVLPGPAPLTSLPCGEVSLGLGFSFAFDVTDVGSQDFLIQIDGRQMGSPQYGSGTGTLEVVLMSPPPPNDTCATASPALMGQTPFDLSGASTTAFAHCNYAAGFLSPDVWFEWTAPQSGDYTLGTCAPSGNLVLAVHEGSCGSVVACASSGSASPDCPGGWLLELDLTGVAAGSTYLVQIEHVATVTTPAQIDGVLDISLTPPDALGTSYCTSAPNSVGAGGATLGLSGSASVAAEDLTLTALQVPDQPGIFYFGPTQIQVVFGEGFRCVGGPVHRLPVSFASSNVLTRVVDFSSSPGDVITAGQTWNFQGWYRDPANGGSAFNLTDAVSLTFLP